MFWYFVLVLIGVFFFLSWWASKYDNPYYVAMFFAPTGVGKSMFLNKEGHSHSNRGWIVYSTSKDVSGIYINPKDLGKFQFPNTQDNLLLIDEASILFNNRDYKSFGKELRAFFKLHRKMHLRIFLASQDFEDVDITLRRLTTKYYLLDRFLGIFVRARKIRKVITLTQAQGSESGTITDSYEYESALRRGSRMYCFLPYWVKRVDSYSMSVCDNLPTMEQFYGSASTPPASSLNE